MPSLRECLFLVQNVATLHFVLDHTRTPFTSQIPLPGTSFFVEKDQSHGVPKHERGTALATMSIVSATETVFSELLTVQLRMTNLSAFQIFLYRPPKITSGVFVYLKALLILDHCQLFVTATALIVPQICNHHHSRNHTLYDVCMLERRFLKHTMPR